MNQYKRVLLKLSGEALAGDQPMGFDHSVCRQVAGQVKELVAMGVQVAVVIGGGNFWRGRTSGSMDRTKADQIGMLATVMNAIYVSDACRSIGLETEVMTPFPCGTFTKAFAKDEAVQRLVQGKVVFFAGGTGHPYFSTDTGAVLRAIEVEADIILAARAVDGVYDSDPKENPDAKKYDEISMEEIVNRKLGVVDLTAAVLAMENHMPMLVFGLNEEDGIVNGVKGKGVGTVVTI